MCDIVTGTGLQKKHKVNSRKIFKKFVSVEIFTCLFFNWTSSKFPQHWRLGEDHVDDSTYEPSMSLRSLGHMRNSEGLKCFFPVWQSLLEWKLEHAIFSPGRKEIYTIFVARISWCFSNFEKRFRELQRLNQDCWLACFDVDSLGHLASLDLQKTGTFWSLRQYGFMYCRNIYTPWN